MRDNEDPAARVAPGAVRPAPELCEGTCNPFNASCGAKFCTYEGMAEHERFHRTDPVLSPVPDEGAQFYSAAADQEGSREAKDAQETGSLPSPQTEAGQTEVASGDLPTRAAPVARLEELSWYRLEHHHAVGDVMTLQNGPKGTITIEPRNIEWLRADEVGPAWADLHARIAALEQELRVAAMNPTLCRADTGAKVLLCLFDPELVTRWADRLADLRREP